MTSARADAIRAERSVLVERRMITRRRFLGAGVALAGVAVGTAGITAGLQGVGTEPTYLEAPVVEKPFTPEDPETYVPTGPDPYAQTASGEAQALGPMELAIPSLDIRASLVDVGLEPGTNNIVIPAPETVGHYTLAAPIGATAGTTLLAGHVNKGMAPGALWNLSKAQKGAPVYVTDAAGKQFIYKVNGARTVLRQPLPEDAYRIDGEPQIMLVTCARGAGTGGYTDNTIITATPQN